MSGVDGRSLRLDLPVEAASIAQARAAIAPALEGMDAAAADDLRLLVSELVTNSVRHAGLSSSERVEIEVRRAPDGVVVEVTDSGPGFDPPPHPVAPTGPSGWGLLLVSRLARRWGVRRGAKTTVWFEMGIATTEAARREAQVSEAPVG